MQQYVLQMDKLRMTIICRHIHNQTDYDGGNNHFMERLTNGGNDNVTDRQTD